MSREPATVLVRVPNPRFKKRFDYCLFSFAHRGGGCTYCVAALEKGSSPSDACREWAYDNFPHSAADEGRHRWKRVALVPRVAAGREVAAARAVCEPPCFIGSPLDDGWKDDLAFYEVTHFTRFPKSPREK